MRVGRDTRSGYGPWPGIRSLVERDVTTDDPREADPKPFAPMFGSFWLDTPVHDATGCLWCFHDQEKAPERKTSRLAAYYRPTSVPPPPPEPY